MTKFNWIFILLLFVNAGCHSNVKKPDNKIELIRLGLIENLKNSEDTSNLGAECYFNYDQNSDSIIAKVCGISSTDFGIYPTGCHYFYQPITDAYKQQFNFLIDHLRPLKNGKIIDFSKYDKRAHSCDEFGVWMAIITDSLDQRHYFIFNCIDIPGPIHDLCWGLFSQALKNKNDTLTGKYINTDSIVQSSFKLLHKDFEELNPKPLPPEIILHK